MVLLRDQKFIKYACGLSIDRLGNSIYAIALPLMVYNITGSLKSMALVTFFQFFPRVFPGIYIGSIVDTFNKKIIFLGALLIQLICSSCLAILYYYQELSFTSICILSAMLSIGFEFSRTSEMTIVPILFKEKRVEATTILASLHTGMFILGPIIAALLINNSSYSFLLFINSISYLVPVVANRKINLSVEKDTVIAKIYFKDKWLSVNRSLMEGINYIFRKKTFLLFVFFIISIGIVTGGLETFIIFYIKNYSGISDAGTSIIYSIGTIGMFLGSLAVPFFKKMNRSILLFAIAFVMVTGSILYSIDIMILIALAQLIMFFSLYSLRVLNDLFVQDKTKIEMLGRTNGIIRTINSIVASLSTLFLTFLYSFSGIHYVFIIIAVIIAFSSIFPLIQWLTLDCKMERNI